VLQCVAVCCSVLQRPMILFLIVLCMCRCAKFSYDDFFLMYDCACSVVQGVVVCCSVLQRVVVGCSVLQCVAVFCKAPNSMRHRFIYVQV